MKSSIARDSRRNSGLEATRMRTLADASSAHTSSRASHEPGGTVLLTTTIRSRVAARASWRAARGQVAEVGFTCELRRRSHAQQRHLGVRQSGADLGEEGQIARRPTGRHQLGQPRLVDRHLATLDHGESTRVDLDAPDLVAQPCEAGGRGQSDVAGAHDADPEPGRCGRVGRRDASGHGGLHGGLQFVGRDDRRTIPVMAPRGAHARGVAKTSGMGNGTTSSGMRVAGAPAV